MEVKIWSLCSVSSTLSHANLEQPFRTLAIKWEVNIFVKKSSCVLYSCVCYLCVGMYPAYICIFLHESEDDYATSVVLWLYAALQYRSCMSSNLLVFHTSGGILSRPAAFLFLVFVSTTSSSSCVNCPSLMSSWFLIFVIGSSVTLGDFPSRFLMCSFRKCIRFSWLAAFSFALAELFILLTSFTVCHAIQDFLSSTECQILLI